MINKVSTLKLLLGVLLNLAAITSSSASIISTPQQIAVFSGGCFWGVDAVFKHVKGVTEVVSGYSGGQANTAFYDQVSAGTTGHAESVRVSFDPSHVSYRQLLQIFFNVAHNPTQLNFQGPDVGTQYRSAIFYTSQDQLQQAKNYMQELTASHTFTAPIVTQVNPLIQFYPAESHHQNYLALHPNQPYIRMNDQPKLDQLRLKFPALYQ